MDKSIGHYKEIREKLTIRESATSEVEDEDESEEEDSDSISNEIENEE